HIDDVIAHRTTPWMSGPRGCQAPWISGISACFPHGRPHKQVRGEAGETDEQPGGGHVVTVAQVAGAVEAIVELPPPPGYVVPRNVDSCGRGRVGVVHDHQRP